MSPLLLLICSASALLILGVASVLLGSWLLGKPLSNKGCGKPNCCHNKDNCDQGLSSTTDHDHT